MDAIDTPPSLSDFTPVSEHQEQTPGSFFGGKPVLHLHSTAATLKVPVDQLEAHADLKRLAGSAFTHSESQVNVSDIDVWVTSRHLTLFSPSQSAGLQILYQTITITAQDGADVLLELNLSDADTADEDIVFLQLRITPHKTSHPAEDTHASTARVPATPNGASDHHGSAAALYKAISDCQELNPDPPGSDEDDADREEGFDETAPGATGWITSENMADFMDENGDFRIPEGVSVVGGEDEDTAEAQQTLGGGAGRTRTAAEALEEEESKWRRTD